jgi:hypothetical protein
MITNKLADRIVDTIDTVEEALQMLKPVLKKRRLSFGNVYYILGMQIVIYDTNKREIWK